jgi:hypothetical protein
MNQADAMVAQSYQYAYASANGVAVATAQAVPEIAPVFRSLMTVGLLGSVYGRHDDSQLVCSAVEPTLDNPLVFRVNRALAQAMGGDSKFAAETINKHLESHPDDDGAKVLLAVSLMLGGDPEWKPILEGVFASSTDQVARQAAMQVVGYLRTLT